MVRPRDLGAANGGSARRVPGRAWRLADTPAQLGPGCLRLATADRRVAALQQRRAHIRVGWSGYQEQRPVCHPGTSLYT